jgi:hypothetical protein
VSKGSQLLRESIGYAFSVLYEAERRMAQSHDESEQAALDAGVEHLWTVNAGADPGRQVVLSIAAKLARTAVERQSSSGPQKLADGLEALRSYDKDPADPLVDQFRDAVERFGLGEIDTAELIQALR